MTSASVEHVARIVRACLRRGGSVNIDGLGVFRPAADGGCEFVPRSRPRVFIAYVKEDAEAARRLFETLAAHGFDAWMDEKKLLPGQNWPRAIEGAIETCDFFLACFSQRAVKKRGGFQSELRFALECASRLPLEETFLIPVRLDCCALPRRIAREFQYVDLFPDWDAGIRAIVEGLSAQGRFTGANGDRRDCPHASLERGG